jgi:transcriptional regulator with XRE-family HTH domain
MRGHLVGVVRLTPVGIPTPVGLRATASAAGISPGYLTLLEQGKRCPSVAVAELIAAALRLGPDLDARLFDVAQPYAGRSRTSSQPSREVTQPDAPSSAQVADATDEGSAAPPKSAKNAPIGDIKAGHAARARTRTPKSATSSAQVADATDEARPASVPPDGRRCRARSKRSGKRCRRRAIPGGTTCVLHGAGAPAVAAAARRRLSDGAVRDLVPRFCGPDIVARLSAPDPHPADVTRALERMRGARSRQPRWWKAADAHNDQVYLRDLMEAVADRIDPAGRSRYCRARRKGKRCRRLAIPGGTTCVLHNSPIRSPLHNSPIRSPANMSVARIGRTPAVAGLSR